LVGDEIGHSNNNRVEMEFLLPLIGIVSNQEENRNNGKGYSELNNNQNQIRIPINHIVYCRDYCTITNPSEILVPSNHECCTFIYLQTNHC
jgi:hypothetical protein